MLITAPRVIPAVPGGDVLEPGYVAVGHGGVAEVGEGLVVSAWDADGVIEALELPGEAFVLAVQWHPEESLADLRLFSAIVEAARSYASGRVS